MSPDLTHWSVHLRQWPNFNPRGSMSPDIKAWPASRQLLHFNPRGSMSPDRGEWRSHDYGREFQSTGLYEPRQQTCINCLIFPSLIISYLTKNCIYFFYFICSTLSTLRKTTDYWCEGPGNFMCASTSHQRISVISDPIDHEY